MKQNILLLCPSLYREKAPEQRFRLYYSPDQVVTARHTNMPVFDSISDHLRRSGEQIDAVLMLCSQEVCCDVKKTELGEMTTLDYLKARFSNRPVQIETLSIGTGEIQDTALLQRLVSSAIGNLKISEANIWVDFTSGLRSYAIMLIFMIRFLEMQQHKVREILYANLSGTADQINEINSCLKVYRLFETYEALDAVDASVSEEEQPAPPTQADQALKRLRRLDRDLRQKLSNDVRKHRGIIRRAKKAVEETLSQFPDDPHIALMAKKIREKLPEADDCYAEIEFALMHGLVDPAVLRFKEAAFRNLEKEGVICVIRNGYLVEAELVSAYRYYLGFLQYIHDILKQLSDGASLDPSAHYQECVEAELEKRYHSSADYYAQNAIVLNSTAMAQYKKHCAAVIARKDAEYQDLRRNTKAQIADPAARNRLLAACQSEYLTKSQIYEQIFIRSGFPLACTHYGDHRYIYSFYHGDLTRKAEALMSALSAIRQGVWNGQAASLLGGRLSPGCNYEQALAYCMDRLEEVLPIAFSPLNPRNPWQCGLVNEDAFYAFLQAYLPLHTAIRMQRNLYAHDNIFESRPWTELNIDEKKNLIFRGIQMMRDIARQERKKTA